MPITFDCACGKFFTVQDEFAGKRTKCPACRASLTVPMPVPPTPEEEFEVVEDEPLEEVDAEIVENEGEVEFEVVEGGSAKKAAEEPANQFDFTDKKPKKKKKRRPPEKETGLAAMYMQEAREEERRDEARAKAAGGRDDGGGGKTLFGVHVTGGVLAGTGMLLSGFMCIIIIMLFKEELGLGDWRLFYGAIAYTTVGGLTLIKSLVFGVED